MNSNWAAENLQVIRTLMERTSVYRRALAPIMIFCGVLGLVGGVAGWWFRIVSLQGFALFWCGIGVVASGGAFILVRQQAIKDSESFWSPPTRRVAQALVPSFSIGLVIAIVGMIYGKENYDPLDQISLAMCWAFAYGCGIHSAGFFMPRGMKLFGFLFVFGGFVLIGHLINVVPLDRIPTHLLMGILFGGLHLAYGIYLYFTEKGKNAA